MLASLSHKEADAAAAKVIWTWSRTYRLCRVIALLGFVQKVEKFDILAESVYHVGVVQ
jgi:hypothetical protein